MRQEVTGRLENWVFDPIHHVIWGNIYGDSRNRFPDGVYIHTSIIPEFRADPLAFIKKTKKGKRVKTLNSLYLLGSKKRK